MHPETGSGVAVPTNARTRTVSSQQMKEFAAATIVILAELAKRRVDPSQALNIAKGRRPKRERQTNHATQRDYQPNDLLTAEEAGAVLQISAKTLANMRCTGNGPTYRKIGGRIRYRYADLLSFIEDKRRDSTSEKEAK